MLQLLTAFPGVGALSREAPASLNELRGSKSVLAGLMGGKETVAWMALSRGPCPWSLRGGGEGGCSVAEVNAIVVDVGAGGAGRHGNWGPSCISPLEQREEGWPCTHPPTHLSLSRLLRSLELEQWPPIPMTTALLHLDVVRRVEVSGDASHM